MSITLFSIITHYLYYFSVPDPTISLLPLMQNSMLGSPQAVSCIVNTVGGVELDSVMITWMGTTVTITNNIRISISPINSSGNNVFNRSLQFTYLVREDEDNYICSVTILETTVTASIELANFAGKCATIGNSYNIYKAEKLSVCPSAFDVSSFS